ncbi:MAG: hypothetical protein WA584_17975 [Pyrinomonadaceae bacterium]
MNRLRIKKLGVLSVAKMYAAMCFVMLLIICVPYGLFIILLTLSASSNLSADQGGFLLGGGGVVVGLFIMIGVPIIYALFAFIGGAIGALIYNLFAGMVGGIEIEVENVQSY